MLQPIDRHHPSFTWQLVQKSMEDSDEGYAAARIHLGHPVYWERKSLGLEDVSLTPAERAKLTLIVCEGWSITDCRCVPEDARTVSEAINRAREVRGV
jgi:hypothetical protein